jgi:hypothetical protein
MSGVKIYTLTPKFGALVDHPGLPVAGDADKLHAVTISAAISKIPRRIPVVLDIFSASSN